MLVATYYLYIEQQIGVNLLYEHSLAQTCTSRQRFRVCCPGVRAKGSWSGGTLARAVVTKVLIHLTRCVVESAFFSFDWTLNEALFLTLAVAAARKAPLVNLMPKLTLVKALACFVAGRISWVVLLVSHFVLGDGVADEVHNPSEDAAEPAEDGDGPLEPIEGRMASPLRSLDWRWGCSAAAGVGR